MRKPNGFGSVYKMSGKRRKPYAVVTTKGFVLENGKAVQKRTYLGYYATRKEAELALAAYNMNPYDTDATFYAVYKRWWNEKADTVAEGTARNYEIAFKHCEPLYDKVFSSLRTSDLEEVVMSYESVGQRQKVKAMLNQMYKFAMKYDIVQTNFAERFSVEKADVKMERQPFTDNEIKRLWEMDDDTAKVVLILIYTGMRVSELKFAEVDYDNWLLKGGSKTEAGRDRIIPIREKIKPLFPISEAIMSLSRDAYYIKVLDFLKDMGHRTHDCRVTFATRYKSADPTALKLIMGHKITDITKAVYTKYTVEELRKFIESVDF